MPLDFMLKILRDEERTDDERKWAAQQAAPYCHPKLTSIDAKLLAEMNATVSQNTVVDVRALPADQRQVLKHLLSQAGSAAEEEGEDDPE